MLIYGLIVLILIYLSRKIDNLWVLIIGSLMVLLYNSPVISDFIINIFSVLDLKTFLIHDRLGILFVLLLIYLITKIYLSVGLDVKVANYVNQPMNRKNNLISFCLSPFSELIRIEKNEWNNPFYILNRLTIAILFPGSFIFVVIYFILSQFLKTQASLFVLYCGNLFLMITIILNIITIILNITRKKEIGYNESTYLYFNQIKKLAFINVVILIIIFVISQIVSNNIILSLLIALAAVFFYDLFYVDIYYHNHHPQSEWVFLQNVVQGFNDWFKVTLYIGLITIFINASINTFANNWHISYASVNYYVCGIIIFVAIVSILVKSKVFPIVFSAPLLAPIISVLNPNQQIFYLGIYVSLVLLITFLDNTKWQFLDNFQIIGIILMSIIIVVPIVVLLTTHSLVVFFSSLILLLIIYLLIVLFFKYQHGKN